GERRCRPRARGSRRGPRVVRQGLAGAGGRRRRRRADARERVARAAHGDDGHRRRTAARPMSSSLRARSGGISVARLEVVAELATLINTTFDLDEIFRTAILKLPRVLTVRRASVALVTADRAHYAIHPLYDRACGGFV